MKTKFVIERQTPEFVYIVGNVATNVEAVLSELTQHHNLGNRRLFYRDSEGNSDEILHDNGVFTGFAIG